MRCRFDVAADAMAMRWQCRCRFDVAADAMAMRWRSDRIPFRADAAIPIRMDDPSYPRGWCMDGSLTVTFITGNPVNYSLGTIVNIERL